LVTGDRRGFGPFSDQGLAGVKTWSLKKAFRVLRAEARKRWEPPEGGSLHQPQAPVKTPRT